VKREILQLGHPTLLRPSQEVTDFGKAAEVANDLQDTLEAFRAQRGFGRGISAPQIGHSLRVFHIHVEEPLSLFNPTIARREGTLMYWDDCFSFPDLLVWVSRSNRVVVEYRNESGAAQVMEAEGESAELLQHEIDHLDGILAIKRAVDPESFCLRGEFERQNKSKWRR